ncbi:sugar phosphate isomerase/epimerase family protein [uncultured Arthrobacter sp.]|uniref:sugar phosphate isomerase/epimerase family protein n=1 Tax=uncultured Arthrobacter sp. TaxID=114050 RepID=UPI0025F7AD4C|nr:sugar phosphate isomerase/epimerase family protein [uncultured Arthrobacter sp.]
MTFRLAIQEHFLEGRNLMEKFEFAQERGFDGIELLGKGDGIFAGRSAELREARAAGVVLPSVCVNMDHFIGDFDPARAKDAREQMKHLLSGIAEAGGFGAVTPNAYALFSRRLPPFEPPRSDEESRASLVEALAELGAHAEAEGALVLLEPLNRYEDFLVNTLADAVSIVEEVSSPGVAVIADTFHMSIEEADIPASIRTAGKHIRHVQLGDSNRLEPGAGHYDWPATLAALEEIGYDGWLAMECRLSGPVRDVLPKVSALLKSPALLAN